MAEVSKTYEGTKCKMQAVLDRMHCLQALPKDTKDEVATEELDEAQNQVLFTYQVLQLIGLNTIQHDFQTVRRQKAQ